MRYVEFPIRVRLGGMSLVLSNNDPKARHFGASNSAPKVAKPDEGPLVESLGQSGRITAAGITIVHHGR